MARLTTVRYGHLRLRGLFTVEAGEVKSGDHCLIRSPRGNEIGVILANPIEQDAGKAGCGESACGSCATPQGTVVRRATDDERTRQRDISKQGVMTEVRFARERSREYRIPMKVVGAEYLFDREKLVVHFASNKHVDFRDLIRDLASRFKTRIEMKQIGARDEARLTGDVAVCGRELCCRSFLHDLQPVAMRMAKQQKKTLDPTKIAGQCGKLKCCLRYEDEVYVELQRTLPRRNSLVRIEEGLAKILNVDLLLQKFVVELENGERKIVHLSQLLETGIKPPRLDRPDRPDSRATEGPRRIAPAVVPGQGGTPADPPGDATSSPPGRGGPAAPRPPPPPVDPDVDDDGPGDPNLEG